MAQKTDIFHPLAYLDWNESYSIYLHHQVGYQCVILEDKVYTTLRCVVGFGSQLGVFSLDSSPTFWHTVDIPSTFASLATYNSQLVIIGGKEKKRRDPFVHLSRYEITNKVWVSGDGGINWESSLPPMPTRRHSTSAVSYGSSPECLIVAGGKAANCNVSHLVEVLKEGRWFNVQSLPKFYTSTKSVTLHKGYWYLTGEKNSGTVCGNLDAFVAAATPTARIMTPMDGTWRRCKTPFEDSCLVSFGEHLLAIGYEQEGSRLSIHAYQPLTQSWVMVQFLPISMIPTVCEMLPSGELLVMGTKTSKVLRSFQPIAFKASLKGI